MNRNLKTQIGRVAAGVAALAMVAGATAASADPYRHGYYRGHRGDETSAAIAGGIVGLALGAAIAGNSNTRYRSGYSYGYAPPPPPPPRYYDYGYAPRPYGYGYGYGRDCWSTREYDRWSGSVYERTVCR
ncbi:MAG: hypothetical protein J7521_22585 [Caulobacter sp.]|nr:hypothetical protein [Caulobacter sp.]